MKHLLFLSIILLIIPTSLQITAKEGIFGDSQWRKNQPYIKMQRNMDNKKDKVSFSFQFRFSFQLFASLFPETVARRCSIKRYY